MKLVASAAIACAFSLTAAGQTNISGDIAGTVTDATGAVVPNATVTVTNKGTGEVKTATSSNTGSYRVSLLPPGNYHVVVSETGFNTS
ncbi:MAG: carboxypeptidase-like regulatory domain-containing protein, partial [Chloroflexi bacterium]|nr:carboxypeptidase-like regulatory domain-containing protein [Chloroflexota bacterium]